MKAFKILTLLALTTATHIASAETNEFDYSRLENVFSNYLDRFEIGKEDISLQDAVQIMSADSINYEKVNNNLKVVSARAAVGSDVLQSLDFSVDSNLTNWWSVKASRYAPWLISWGRPYVHVQGDMTFVDGQNQKSQVKGFNLKLNFDRGIGIRGITGWSYTNYYGLQVGVKMETFAVLKEIFAEYDLSKNCEEMAREENQDPAEDVTFKGLNLKEVLTSTCNLASAVDSEKDLNGFLKKTKNDFAVIEDAIDKLYAVDESLDENMGAIGRAAGEVFEFATSTYKFKVNRCWKMGDTQINPYCKDSLTVILGAEVGVGGVDSETKITTDEMQLSVSGSSAARYTQDYDVTAAISVYSAFKTIESANNSELRALGTQLEELVMSLKGELDSWADSRKSVDAIVIQ